MRVAVPYQASSSQNPVVIVGSSLLVPPQVEHLFETNRCSLRCLLPEARTSRCSPTGGREAI